jgi:hypothetical protein
MKNTESELLWQSSVHLGDEPGIFGNSFYSGLAFELPVTLESQDGSEKPVSLSIKTDLVKVFAGYKGHKITVTRFDPDASSSNPYDWTETVIAEDVILDSSAEKLISFNVVGKKVFVSIRVEADTSVQPGLYNDFLLERISFISENYDYFASLGFR